MTETQQKKDCLYLYKEMPDGYVYVFDARGVAHDRAAHYAESEFSEDNDVRMKVYTEEYEYAMKYTAEIKEWAVDNMNFSDALEHLITKYPVRKDIPTMEEMEKAWLSLPCMEVSKDKRW